MPRFTARGDGTLNRELAALGLSELFIPGKADFSAMSANAPGLAIDELRQADFLNVDEEGTEAAAATSVMVVGALPQPEPRFTFNAEHPFLLALRDATDGAVLFIAAIRDPPIAAGSGRR